MRPRFVLLPLAACLGIVLAGFAATGCGSGTAVSDSAVPLGAAPTVPSPSRTAPMSASPSPRPVPGAAPIGQPAPVVDFGPRTKNQVALTFDADLTHGMRAKLMSGKVASYANTRVLDVLEQHRVPATFFLTGMFAEQYPRFVRRIADNPEFDLANHSFSHRGFTANCYDLGHVPQEQMADDVARTFAILEPFGGNQTRFFRFPGLCHDQVALRTLGELGVTVVDGDVVSGDPFATDPDRIANAVLGSVRPGSIVIMHCTDVTAPVTDRALPRIIAGLRKQGLEPVTLSTLLGPPQQAASL